MTETSPTLAARYAALSAERKRTWEPEKLSANIALRQGLVAAFDPEAVVKPGDRVAPFTLELSTGGTVTLDALLAGGPLALLFFRFGDCPACAIALPHYDRHLRPALEAAGIGLVGLSPHLPETGLDEVRLRHGLGFPLAVDRGNVLARRFNLTFQPPGPPPAPEGEERWVGALTGTGTWELPQPAIILIDQDRVVRFASVSPDWLDRIEAEDVLAAARDIGLAPALS